MKNFNEFLNRQKTEDRRAFIVHYPAKSGKTRFAQKVCKKRNDTYYVDLQAYANEHQENFPSFGFSILQQLLLGLDIKESVIVVDNPDFMFNVWESSDQVEFENWLRIQLRSPSITNKTFVFFVQSDPYFTNMKLKNSRGESRVLLLSAFEAL
jgi:hypothetical protein